MKRKTIVIAIILMGISFLCKAQTINTSKSKVLFEIQNFTIKKVKGTIKGMKGNLNFSPVSLSNSFFNVCIDPGTIDTGNAKRDTQLKNAEFFHIARYPEICFISTSVEKSGISYKTTGRLTMHGVTKEVEILFLHSGKTFTGKLKLNRLDYNIGPQATFPLSKDVTMKIECVLD